MNGMAISDDDEVHSRQSTWCLRNNSALTALCMLTTLPIVCIAEHTIFSLPFPAVGRWQVLEDIIWALDRQTAQSENSYAD